MKRVFKIIDSGMHIIEFPGMWEQYIDGAFKARAPKFVGKCTVGTYLLRQCFVGAEEERDLKQVVEQIGDDDIV